MARKHPQNTSGVFLLRWRALGRGGEGEEVRLASGRWNAVLLNVFVSVNSSIVVLEDIEHSTYNCCRSNRPSRRSTVDVVDLDDLCHLVITGRVGDSSR